MSLQDSGVKEPWCCEEAVSDTSAAWFTTPADPPHPHTHWHTLTLLWRQRGVRSSSSVSRLKKQETGRAPHGVYSSLSEGSGHKEPNSTWIQTIRGNQSASLTWRAGEYLPLTLPLPTTHSQHTTEWFWVRLSGGICSYNKKKTPLMAARVQYSQTPLGGSVLIAPFLSLLTKLVGDIKMTGSHTWNTTNDTTVKITETHLQQINHKEIKLEFGLQINT